ncbi:MAG TPA: cytidylate kinase, partial [Methanosarcinales archaeon]|nr:cytidylate kinase [Methanosarcinales archaeon]
MIITISGKPGSGKSTVAKALSDYFLMDLVSSGEVFRQLAKEQHKTLLEFGKLCESNPEIDRMIDERQKKIAQEHDNIIIEGRLSGYLIKADLKIWLKASLGERAKSNHFESYKIIPDAVGLVQGQVSAILAASDIAEKAAAVQVAEIKGMCPTHMTLIALYGDTSA